MSKLSKSIDQRFTGEKKLPPSRLKVDFSSSPTYNHIVGKELLLKVSASARGYVEDNVTTPGDNSVEVIKALRRALIEEVFGEFRHFFIEMNVAMYEYDMDRLKNLLAIFENQMFVE